MRIDLSTIMFNMDLPVGGQPAWGTALGQSEGHKFTYPGYENILIGLLYNKINDIENVFCPLGKGGHRQDDYEMVIAGLFKKIYVNDNFVPNSSFVLLVVKQLVASQTSMQHIGRRTLKYNNGMTYNGKLINEDCYKKMANVLGLNENSAWFVSDIDVKNQDELHFKAFIANKDKALSFNNTEERKSFCQDIAGMQVQTGGTNVIYYGAPGCGKSYFVNKELDNKKILKDDRIRVTFHPEFSNTDFIGQILPTIEKTIDASGKEKDVVKYTFNPGPFTLALKRARETNKMVYLIIEEINRGNASAIFGDLFQLLDRKKDPSKDDYGESEYPICNPNMQKFLGMDLNDELYIPCNLTILATMNSSDQNVFTLDTAFKRRWAFVQIPNDIEKDNVHSYKKFYIPGTEVTWEKFLVTINNAILDYKIHNQTNEDKRLGKYFVSKDCLIEPNVEITDKEKNEAAKKFAYKVLEYIWNDVCKIGREDWFNTESYKTLEDLINAFINPKEGETSLSIFANLKFE